MGGDALGKPLTPILVIFLGYNPFLRQKRLRKAIKGGNSSRLSNSYNLQYFWKRFWASFTFQIKYGTI